MHAEDGDDLFGDFILVVLLSSWGGKTGVCKNTFNDLSCCPFMQCDAPNDCNATICCVVYATLLFFWLSFNIGVNCWFCAMSIACNASKNAHV